MKHGFYTKSKSQQNRVQLFIATSALLITFLAVFVSWIAKVYFLGILIILVVITIIAPFFDTPSLKKNGKLRYLSLLLITEIPKNGVLKIHGGTLFDYVFVIDKKMNGNQRTNFIIQKYLEGVLNLIAEYENKKINNLTIRGTSYIINDRTAERIGFKVIRTDLIQKFILVFNYFNVLISYSIAKDKLSFPKVSDTKTFEAKLVDLAKRKVFLMNLNNKLKSSIQNRES